MKGGCRFSQRVEESARDFFSMLRECGESIEEQRIGIGHAMSINKYDVESSFLYGFNLVGTGSSAADLMSKCAVCGGLLRLFSWTFLKPMLKCL